MVMSFHLNARGPYSSGYVSSVAKDAMAAVGKQQRCTKLSDVGDGKGVF